MEEIWYPNNKTKHIGYQNKIKAEITKFILDLKK